MLRYEHERISKGTTVLLIEQGECACEHIFMPVCPYVCMYVYMCL